MTSLHTRCEANSNNIVTFGTRIWDSASGRPGQGLDTERCRWKEGQDIMKETSDKQDLDGYSGSNSRLLHLYPPCAYMSFSESQRDRVVTSHSVFKTMHAKETVPEESGNCREIRRALLHFLRDLWLSQSYHSYTGLLSVRRLVRRFCSILGGRLVA